MDADALLDVGKKKDISSVIVEIDKHIRLRFLKEKKTNRTYILGLDDFIPDSKKLADYVKHIQKTLSTGMTEKDEDGKKVFGFQGDHRTKIEQLLMSELNIPKTKIRK